MVGNMHRINASHLFLQLSNINDKVTINISIIVLWTFMITCSINTIIFSIYYASAYLIYISVLY